MSRRKALTAQAPTVLTTSSPFLSKMDSTNQEREERSQRMASTFSEETRDQEMVDVLRLKPSQKERLQEMQET